LASKRSLDPEEVQKLLALPTRKPRTDGDLVSIPGTTKRIRINLDDRSWEMWWKLPTMADVCAVPNHDEDEADRKRMCMPINDVMVCRYCYVNSRDKRQG
jgi:hypothetical protein